MTHDPVVPDPIGSATDGPIHRARPPNPIQALRQERGLSIAELAHAAGMDPAHLELIERDPHLAAPDARELEGLARALGVPIEALR